MRRFLLGLALLLAQLGPAGSLLAAEEQAVVLIVRADSSVGGLDSLTVRKLFMGWPVLINGALLHPIRNRSDSQLDEIFLQQVVAVSQSTYERQMLVGLNRRGSIRPSEVSSEERVLQYLYDDPNAVSFAWLRDVAHNPRVRVIRVLWSY